MVKEVVGACCGDGAGEVADIFADGLEHLVEQINDKKVISIIKQSLVQGITGLVAEEMESRRKKLEEQQQQQQQHHKTEVIKLNRGNVDQFFCGLEDRIGRPSRDLEQAIEREHSFVLDDGFGASHKEFTSINYRVTTTPFKEFRFVFRGEGQTSRGQNLGFREKATNEEILATALQRFRVSEHFVVTKQQFQQIGLLSVEVGALRLYTGLFGLIWFDLVWFGLIWFGLIWFGLISFGLISFGLI